MKYFSVLSSRGNEIPSVWLGLYWWGFCSESCWDVKTYFWGISGICECHCSYSRAALAAFWAHVLLLLAHSLPCSILVSRKTLDILRICFLLIFLVVCHLLTFAHDLKLSQHCPYILLHHLLPECYQISLGWKKFCCLFVCFFTTLYQTVEFEDCYRGLRRCFAFWGVKESKARAEAHVWIWAKAGEKVFQHSLLDIWWEQLWGWGQSISSVNAICLIANADRLAYLICHKW